MPVADFVLTNNQKRSMLEEQLRELHKRVYGARILKTRNPADTRINNAQNALILKYTEEIELLEVEYDSIPPDPPIGP